jgi:hypothetical protein
MLTLKSFSSQAPDTLPSTFRPPPPHCYTVHTIHLPIRPLHSSTHPRHRGLTRLPRHRNRQRHSWVAIMRSSALAGYSKSERQAEGKIGSVVRTGDMADEGTRLPEIVSGEDAWWCERNVRRRRRRGGRGWR